MEYWLLIVTLVDCLTCEPVNKAMKLRDYPECAVLRDNVEEFYKPHGYRKVHALCVYVGVRPPVWPLEKE